MSVFVGWNLGSLAGALLGGSVGDPRTLGLDAMFPAAFLALLVPQLARPEARIAAVCGGLVALVLVPLTPAGLPILAAVLGLVPAVARLRAIAPEAS